MLYTSVSLLFSKTHSVHTSTIRSVNDHSTGHRAIDEDFRFLAFLLNVFLPRAIRLDDSPSQTSYINKLWSEEVASFRTRVPSRNHLSPLCPPSSHLIIIVCRWIPVFGRGFSGLDNAGSFIGSFVYAAALSFVTAARWSGAANFVNSK